MADALSQKVQDQIRRAQLPQSGEVPFIPKLSTNRRGQQIIEKAEVRFGPKKGKIGYLDASGRIWIRDRAHANDPDHWDVQIEDGIDYIRVGLNGEPL